MGKTKIEWCDRTWSPVTGCSPISEGCAHCYAQRMAKRLAGRYGYPKDEPFRPTFHEDKLTEPFRWKKPQRIFVCSMGDLFHPDIKDEWINAVFASMVHPMSGMSHHTYMILTKRPDRILKGHAERFAEWPNLWLGVTVESNEYLWRIEELLKIPAAVHFVSLEPMLGEVDIWPWINAVPFDHHCPKCGFTPVEGMEEYRLIHGEGATCVSCGHDISRPFKPIDWVILGHETGPKPRPAEASWFIDVIDQCRDAGVPVFVKKVPDGVPIIREYPDGKV